MSSPSTSFATRRCRSIVAAFVLASACHRYQGEYIAAPAPLLERSFVAPSLDKRDTMLYEAQAVTNLFLRDNLLERERELRRDEQPLTLYSQRLFVMPLFRIRQLSDSSAAVRTPSFNPSLRFELHRLTGDTTKRVAHADKRELKAIRDAGFRAEWTHHSNGQAGCFRSGFVPDSTGDPDHCTPGLNADITGVGLNRANGDFSTTYWGLTGFWRHVALDRAEQTEKWSFAAGLQYQFHKYGFFGDMRPEQRALYGTHRGRIDASFRYVFGFIDGRIDGLYERAEHTHPTITPWRAHVDVSVRSPYTLGAGFLVRFLDGQDYYNIGFAQRRSRILFGILLDPSQLEAAR